MPMNPEGLGAKISRAIQAMKIERNPLSEDEKQKAAVEYQTREAHRHPTWRMIEHLIGGYDDAVKNIPPGFTVRHTAPVSKNGIRFETVVSVRFSDKTTDFWRERVSFYIEETVPGERLLCHVSLKPGELAEKVRNKIDKLAKQRRFSSNLSKVFRR